LTELPGFGLDPGAATVATNGEYTVLKGYLEQSDVSLSDEMAALIVAQRGYQLSARVVQTADEVEQTVNSLRG
jgi:flagellar basal-body rod protein FlgG